MAVLKPIVIDLPTRGRCAIDYIDYFDEGQYGPDKPFFVSRFDDFTQVAKQMRACLSLQGNENSLIHFRREHIDGKWGEPLVIEAGNEPYPYRAQYRIRFMLRIKFYGDFAYLDLGQKWAPEHDPSETYYVEAKDLEVVNRCMLSETDAEKILEYILNAEVESGKTLSQVGPEQYVPGENGAAATIQPLTTGPVAEALAAIEKERMATYVGDANYVLSDGDTLLTIE